MAKGCTPRGNRWTYREELKEASNRHGSRWAIHPQVARQIDEESEQMKEVSNCNCGGRVCDGSCIGGK